MSGEVMLGYVSGGWVRSEFMNSVFNAVSGPESDPAIGGVISSSAGPLVALGRNLLVKQFLSHDKEWLCSIDTDIVFATDAISRLLEVADPVERPVVSALYHIFWDGKKTPAAYRAHTRDGELTLKNFVEDDLDILDAARDNAPLDVAAVGAGFLLVHRSVFETIQDKADGQPCWFREAVIGGRDLGEDISFCIRCANIPVPIYLHASVEVGHIKSAMLGKVT